MKSRISFALTAAALALYGNANAATLTTGDGDATVDVDVTEYGTFGTSTDGGDGLFDPEGATGPTHTIYESGVAIGDSSGRQYLSGDISGPGGATGGSFSATSDTEATSTFTFGNLAITLVQIIEPLFDMGVQTGSQLTQTYTITNTGDSTEEFEVVRYLDGDLNDIADGGGLIVGGDGTLTLFETDTATGTDEDTIFVSISSSGGIVPDTGYFEVDSFSGLRGRIADGTALDDTVTGDGVDLDTFIDAGGAYDVTLALLNYFVIGAGETVDYVTTTIWGTGAPDDFVTPQVPLPGAIFFFATGLAGLGFSRRRKPA